MVPQSKAEGQSKHEQQRVGEPGSPRILADTGTLPLKSRHGYLVKYRRVVFMWRGSRRF